MAIQPEDEFDLSFLFGADRLFWRSAMGSQLARAESIHTGSAAGSWEWNPPNPVTGAQKPPPTYVSYAATHEAVGSGYEVPGDKLVTLGRVSARALALYRGKDTRLFYGVLQAYYGDRGCRWAASSVSRYELDEKGNRLIRDGHEVELYKGLGPGAIAAIFPFTSAGGDLLRWEAQHAAKQRNGQVKKKVKGKPSAAARRRELEHAIAELGAELAVLLEREQQGAEKVNALRADLKTFVEPARQRALRRAVAAARLGHQEAEQAASDARRRLALLRSELLPPGLPSPRKTEEASAALAARADLLAAYEASPAYQDWLRVSTLARSMGATLPDPPPPPELPPLPALRLPLHVAAQPPPDLSPDDRLEVALVLEGYAPNPHRRLLLQRAHRQANDLLLAAWKAWSHTAPRLKHQPRTIRVEALPCL